jgi:hypothetical protein
MSVHTKKPQSEFSQYRRHARSVSLYYQLKTFIYYHYLSADDETVTILLAHSIIPLFLQGLLIPVNKQTKSMIFKCQ